MVSPSNQGEESRTPSQRQSWIPPLSPQLRYLSSRRQPPRNKVPPPSSSSLPPLSSPQTVALITQGSYCKVPSNWSPERRLFTRNLYLSRTSLLKKMIHQSILYRRLEPVLRPKDEKYLGIKSFGKPTDYWVTMPIHPPILPENSDPPELKGVALNVSKGISIGFVTGPVPASRYALNRLVGFGYDRDGENYGLPFHWVRNMTGTKFFDFDTAISPSSTASLIGFVECTICGDKLCAGYVLPTRIIIVKIIMGSVVEELRNHGDRAASSKFSQFSCPCDANKISIRPIISDVLNKINWVFLFLGFGIRYCTVDQLKYYCRLRKLPISEEKKEILVTVFDDLSQQITKLRIVPVYDEEDEPL